MVVGESEPVIGHGEILIDIQDGLEGALGFRQLRQPKIRQTELVAR